jgi:hypothetical protein
MKKISVLGVSKNSVYKTLGVDCYDINRDLRTFNGSNPIITHAPCRKWSAFLSHFSKAPENERELAIFCAYKVIENGGIFEHPAYSRIFGKYLPLPGKREGELITIPVWQSWWGYPTRKATWLCFSKINTENIILPFKLGHPDNERKTFENMSKDMRSHTTLEFARWLIKTAVKVNEN